MIESLNTYPDALGFSLRHGTNTSYCYPLRVDQELLTFSSIEHDFLLFDWTVAEHDFAYPLEVSSSVYRVKDITAVLQDSFVNPNTLEAYLNHHKMAFSHKNLLL